MPDDTLTTGAARAAGLLTIAQAAEAAGLTERQVRLYEDSGLVTPERSSGGYRLYSPAQVTALRLIGLGRVAGFGLEAIGDLLDAATLPPDQRKGVYRMVSEHLKNVQAFARALAEFYAGDKP